MVHKVVVICCCLLMAGLAACSPGQATSLPATLTPSATPLPTLTATPLPSPTSTSLPTPTVRPLVPDFKHIIVIFFENHEFDTVIGNSTMPNYNRYAQGNTLLTQYYAITHPSLPNYLAVFGGNTFGISTDCEDCFVSAPNLMDQVEASGRTWRAYFQDMPHPCFVKDTAIYVQKHNPFMYFDSIRLDATRCDRSVVPFPQLETDLAAGSLPDFVYIMPNSCVSTDDIYGNPDCNLGLADGWLGGVMGMLRDYLDPRGSERAIPDRSNLGRRAGESFLLWFAGASRRTRTDRFDLPAGKERLPGRHPLHALLFAKDHRGGLGAAISRPCRG